MPTTQPVATPTYSHAAGTQQPPSASHSSNPAPAPPQRSTPQHGISVPFALIDNASPLDLALIGALMVLPLLFGLWLLLFGRTMSRARHARDAHIRLRLAADLGLHPRDLESMSTQKLFALRDKAAFDEVTGLLRAAAGIGAADREVSRARDRRSALSVAFVALDGLKEANDANGRAAGNALLLRTVDEIRRGLRGGDVLIRYAGDELVCVLPDTDLTEARGRLDEIQLDAARAAIRMSVGLAELGAGDDVVSLFARADRDLQRIRSGQGEIVPLPLQDGAASTRRA